MKHWKRIGSAVLAMLLCRTFLPLIRADAAASYKVKETRVDDVTYYSVYSNSEEQNEDQFFTTAYDVYESTGSYRYTITFYQPFQSAEKEQADALAKYLADRSGSSSYVGWYSFTRYGETFCWVYRIEGWDPGDSVYNLEEAGPWRNRSGECCNIRVIGRGDLISESWNEIHNTLECSTAVWIPQNSPKDGMTLGFSFNSGEGTETVWRYCPEQSG